MNREDALETAPRPRKRWIPAVLGLGVVGVFVHLLLFVFVAVPLGKGPAAEVERPFAAYLEKEGEAQRLLQEQAMLLDSKPLFMPTPWNVASSLQDIARLRDEAELFAPYPAIVRLRTDGWSPGPHALPLATTSIEARLHSDPVYPLTLFGQREKASAAPALTERVAAVSIENLGAGSAPADYALSGLPDASAPERLWNPAVFLVVVDPRTGGGRALREVGSGDADWDEALGRYLVSQAFRERLASGYYRVTIGP